MSDGGPVNPWEVPQGHLRGLDRLPPAARDLDANIAGAARQISRKDAATSRHWYTIAHAQAMGDLADFGHVGDPRSGVAAFAAASPGMGWPENRAAVRSLMHHGMPGGVLGSNVEDVPGYSPVGFGIPHGYRFLEEAYEHLIEEKFTAGPTGAKRGPFFQNLSGQDVNALTLDSRMSQIVLASLRHQNYGGGLDTKFFGSLSGKDALRGEVTKALERQLKIWGPKLGIKNLSEFQAVLWSGHGGGAELGNDWEMTKGGVRIPRHPGLEVPFHRAMGGIVGPGAGILQTAADWASDPFMAMMAWQSQQAKRTKHAARGIKMSKFRSDILGDIIDQPLGGQMAGRVARDFAGRPFPAELARIAAGALSPEGRRRAYSPQDLVGAPRPALPWMQDQKTAEQVARWMGINRHLPKTRPMASGGPAERGLYIVNEQGDNSEGFVAGRDAHLIPKFVMDRIPHARDGARTGMIRKPANSLFSPEQNGIIVPKWAVPYVPALHAQAGVRMRPGFTDIAGVAVPAGADAETIRMLRTYANTGQSSPEQLASQFSLQTTARHMAERAKEVADFERVGAARGRAAQVATGRPNVGRALAEGRAGLGKEMPSRTVQGAVAAVSSFLFGGVQQLSQAQVRRSQAEQVYQKSFRQTDAQVKASAGVMGEYREKLRDTNLSQEERVSIEQDRADYLAKTKPALRASVALEKERGEALRKADLAARPTNSGILKNIGVIIGATTAYGMAMQAANTMIQPAVDGSVKATQAFADQLMGFGSTATRVTKGLGDSLNQNGGNLEKTFGDMGLQSRMSASFATFLEKTLGGAAVAKAASANQGQQSDMFRAALGAGNNNAPTGLYGGYGGVLGTSFLGSEMGGGKGFMEQIAGDVGAFAGPRTSGLFNPESIGKGLLLAQNQRFRDYVTGQAKQQQPGGGPLGIGGDLLGGAGDVLRNVTDLGKQAEASDNPLLKIAGMAMGVASFSPLGGLFPKTETPSNNSTGAWQNPALLGKGDADKAGIESYLKNLGAEADRGAKALGTVSKYTYQLATSEEQLAKATTAAAQSGDTYAVDMATNGVILADATGNIATSAKDFADVTSQMAKGATIPDMGTYVMGVRRALDAGFEAANTMAQQQLSVGIPGQLGMQLAAQPFIPAAAGILPPNAPANVGNISGMSANGINVGTTLRTAQAAQDELTKQGAAALTALTEWVGNQPGMNQSITVAPGETYTTGKAAFTAFTGQMSTAGAAIAGWQNKIAGAQAAQQWAQYSNNLRLANRSYADALALAGRGGGPAGTMGALQRQGAMLGFMLSQKQIDFQTALAGFQAPGLTSEERGARQAQAILEAKIAQKQLNIQKGEFSEGAKRGVVDTRASISLLKQEQATQTAVAAAQKAIATEQVKLSQAQAKAQVVLGQAEGNFATVVNTTRDYVSQFGGSVKEGTKVIYGALGFTKNSRGQWVQTSGPGSSSDPRAAAGAPPPGGNAAGYLGQFGKGAVMTVGEAGPETVAILRNPRAYNPMGSGGFGGGSGAVTVNLNLTVQGDVKDEATIAKIVRAVEDSFNRKAARIGMRSYVSSTS